MTAKTNKYPYFPPKIVISETQISGSVLTREELERIRGIAKFEGISMTRYLTRLIKADLRTRVERI